MTAYIQYMGSLSEDMNLEISLGPSDRQIQECALNESMWESVTESLGVLLENVDSCFERHIDKWENSISLPDKTDTVAHMRKIVSTIVEESHRLNESIDWNDSLKLAYGLKSATSDSIDRLIELDVTSCKFDISSDGSMIKSLYESLSQSSECISPYTQTITHCKKIFESLGAIESSKLFEVAEMAVFAAMNMPESWTVTDELSWSLYNRFKEMKYGNLHTTNLMKESYLTNSRGVRKAVHTIAYQASMYYMVLPKVEEILSSSKPLFEVIRRVPRSVKAAELISGAHHVARNP